MDLLNTTNVLITLVVGIFSVIGGIVGAVVFVNKSVDNKVKTAFKSVITSTNTAIVNHSTLQASKDELCAQDRQGLDLSLQTVVSKHVLLEAELRSPNTGVYVRLREVETTLKYVEKEIEDIKRTVQGG